MKSEMKNPEMERIIAKLNEDDILCLNELDGNPDEIGKLYEMGLVAIEQAGGHCWISQTDLGSDLVFYMSQKK